MTKILNEIKKLLEKKGYEIRDLGSMQGTDSVAFFNGDDLITIQQNFVPDEEELEELNYWNDGSTNTFGGDTGIDADFKVKK